MQAEGDRFEPGMLHRDKNMKCIVCKKDLELELRHPSNGTVLPSGGTLFRGRPQYGSGYDFDGTGDLEVCVCDDCLAQAADGGEVDLIVSVQAERKFFRAPWDPKLHETDQANAIVSAAIGVDL